MHRLSLSCVLLTLIMVVRVPAGHVVGGGRSRPRRGGTIEPAEAGDGRRPGGARVAVPGEAEDATLLQEDPLRGAQAQRREAAADEGTLRQACHRRRRRRHRQPRVGGHESNTYCAVCTNGRTPQVQPPAGTPLVRRRQTMTNKQLVEVALVRYFASKFCSFIFHTPVRY
jgi:hypothetical protein